MNEPSKTAREILEYPLSVKAFAWIHLSLSALLGAGTVYTLYSAGIGVPALTIAFLFGFNLCAFYWVLLPKATSSFHVFDDRLEIRRGKKVAVARFSEVAKVFGRVFPFGGGSFGFVMKSGEIHAFSAGLRGGEKILDAIAEFDPARKSSLTELRTNLVVCGHGYERVYEYFTGSRAFLTFVHLGLLPFLFSAYLVGRQAAMMTVAHPKLFFFQAAFGIYLGVVTLALTFGIALNWILDLPTLERMIANPGDRGRDLDRERNILRDAFPVYLFALFSLFGVYNRFDLNTLSRTEVSVDVPHLGYHAGQTLWIDGRANCLVCSHSLREGDVVVFTKEGSAVLGKLVALPGSPVPPSGATNSVRAPASNLPLVPPGKSVIRSNADGSLDQLVDLADIRGRVEENLENFFQRAD